MTELVRRRKERIVNREIKKRRDARTRRMLYAVMKRTQVG